MTPNEVIDLVSSDDDDEEAQQPSAKKLKTKPQGFRPFIASASGRTGQTNNADSTKANGIAQRKRLQAQSTNGGHVSIDRDGKRSSGTATRPPQPSTYQISPLRPFKQGPLNGSTPPRGSRPARMSSDVVRGNGTASNSERRGLSRSGNRLAHLESSMSTKPRSDRYDSSQPQGTNSPARQPPITVGCERPQSLLAGCPARIVRPPDTATNLDAKPRPVIIGDESPIYDDRDDGASIKLSGHRLFKRRKKSLELGLDRPTVMKLTQAAGAREPQATRASLRQTAPVPIEEVGQRRAESALALELFLDEIESSAGGNPGQFKDDAPSRLDAVSTLLPTGPPLPPIGLKQKTNPRYTDEEKVLIARLKDIDRLSWATIAKYFPSRSKGSLKVTYITSIKGKPQYTQTARKMQRLGPPAVDHLLCHLPPAIAENRPNKVRSERKLGATEEVSHQPVFRRKRGGGPSAVDGFISWESIGSQDWEAEPQMRAKGAGNDNVRDPGSLTHQDRAFPSSASRILRHRELGNMGSHGWYCRAKGISDELKDQALTGYSVARYYSPTCGDVTCLAWAPDGNRFAAGSIAVSDERSMQYNGGRNLLIGDSTEGLLHELSEHHVPRPVVRDETNVNARTSMRESQDPRLFQTIAAVGFSRNGQYLFSAGSDNMVRRYATDKDILSTTCENVIHHDGRVDMLDVGRQGLLATGSHLGSDGSVRVFHFEDNMCEAKVRLSPERSAVPLYPTALKFGISSHHSHFLLAGFSSDFSGDALDVAGEMALWDVMAGKRIPLSTVTRNVFELAWNPQPSSASTAFCIASGLGLGRTHPGRRTVLQCFAPSQLGARQVLELDCPALDINDVVFCPYDTQFIAAGATDGNVYVYDARMASKHQGPLHILKHGDTLNVIDHDQDIEHADTGVRFLSWGATASRLYTGSSDGVVKVWNPYRCTSGALVRDAVQLQSAIMSGSFSPDFTQLLLGEENGRLNLLSIGCDREDGTVPRARQFFLNASEVPGSRESPFAAARDMLKRGQIETRPMGTLPKQQAVQGPTYEGPFFDPSAEELSAAEAACERAVKEQDELRSRFALENPGSANNEAMGKADARVEEAQDYLVNLKRRQQEFLELKPAAEQLQKHFRDARKQHMQHEDGIVDCCKLDCKYFSPDFDYEKGVPDSGRSAQRIPGALRSMPRHHVDKAELTCSELFEYGMAGRCPYCPSKRFELQCRQRCDNIKAGFKGMCEECSAPVQASRTAAGSALCERCRFGCLRCTGVAQLVVGPAGKEQTLYCSNCEESWEVGVLGYEVAVDTAQSSKSRRSGTRIVEVDSEQDYYHARWQPTLAMRCVKRSQD